MPSLKNDGPLIALTPTTAGDSTKAKPTTESPEKKEAHQPNPKLSSVTKVQSLDRNDRELTTGIEGINNTNATAQQGVELSSRNVVAEKNLINTSKNGAPRKNGYHRTHSQYLEPNHLLHDDEEENTYENEELYSDEIMLLASTTATATTTGDTVASVVINGHASSPPQTNGDRKSVV